jgi:hypothetical protein
MNNSTIEYNSQAKEEVYKFIKQLREEASHAKSCFTQYSFQSLTFSAIAIGLISSNVKENPISSLAVIPVLILLDIVCWIGIYKYTAANKAYGYQLYIEKVLKVHEDMNKFEYRNKDWQNKIACEQIFKNNNWEKTFRVLRVIEPTIFNKIYLTPTYINLSRHRIAIIELFLAIFSSISLLAVFNWTINLGLSQELLICIGIILVIVSFLAIRSRYTSKIILVYNRLFNIRLFDYTKIANTYINKFSNTRTNQANETWFIIRSSYKNNNIVYYSGTYLKNMLRILFMMQWIALLPIGMSIIRKWRDFTSLLAPNENIFSINKLALADSERFSKIYFHFSQLFFFIFILTCLAYFCIYLQLTQIEKRRKIIDNGLHSIHSFSIIWQVVAFVHFISLRETNNLAINSEGKYIENIFKLAEFLSEGENVFYIDNFIEKIPEIISKSKTSTSGKIKAGSFSVSEDLTVTISTASR